MRFPLAPSDVRHAKPARLAGGHARTIPRFIADEFGGIYGGVRRASEPDNRKFTNPKFTNPKFNSVRSPRSPHPKPV
jgi:hypothetical protein